MKSFCFGTGELTRVIPIFMSPIYSFPFLEQYMNTLVFMATLYLVRGRIGGWHAPYAWLCILLTTIQTWTVLYIVAPVLADINPFFTWALNLSLEL